MTLSRWRRIATGIAAGVIVLCAALIGASFRDTSSGVSVAQDLRTPSAIPIPESEEELAASGDSTDDTVESADDADVVAATDVEATGEDAADEDAADEDAADTGDSPTDAVTVIEPDDLPSDDLTSDDTDTPSEDTDEAATSDDDTAASASDSDASADDAAADTQEPAVADEPAEQATTAAPLTSTDDALGTGGGVDDAECALDRLVIYAGARVGGVAGQIRSALAQAGFGSGCPAPVTVLASNCPLQFAGVLGAGSGYDPNKSFVAASDSVDRETMTSVMGQVGFTGNQIDILDFGFVNADKPGEQWIAIFIPPAFTGWENLAARAGLSPTTAGLCASSGELGG